MHTIGFPASHHMAISPDDRAFFVDLGARIAAQRKDQGITQMQLAEILGVSQQAMNSFEKGRRRVPVSLLPAIARALDTSIEALIGDEEPRAAKPVAKKRGPAPKIQQQLARVATLSKAKQRAIAQVLDSMLAQPRR
jgi:transcriptional regulator with XRE-family HTH domain